MLGGGRERMTFEADLVSLLTGDPAIAARIEDVAANERRIYPLERPADQKNLEAIVYSVIEGIPAANLEDGDLDGSPGDLEEVRLQLDVWGASHDSARSLALLIHARMKTGNASIRAVRNSRQSDVDPDTRENREILDYSVWHSPQ